MSQAAHFFVKESKLYLPSNNWFEERAIGDFNESNQQHLIDALKERFGELIQQVNEVEADFSNSTDKIKLVGKIVRTKSYICTAKAIGDFASLLSRLDIMENDIKVLVDEVLQQKEKLCVDAEALLETKEWKEATDKLRELQKHFKELPTVPDLKNEELKNRFETTKDEFFKRKQASFESFEQDLLDNLSKKLELCEKAEALQHSTEWKKTSEAYQQMNEEWKQIGIVPKHRIEELWFRFSTAKDIFFKNKKDHFEKIKSEQEGNLEKKEELVAKAEALKESKDWKKTSELYIQLMEEWKKVGRVSQDKSDEIWNKFLDAKNYFFQQKDNYYNDIRLQLENNHAKKMAIVLRAEELQNTNDFDNATREYLEMMEEWKTIGRVPKEYGDEPWERFNKAKKIFFDRKDQWRDTRKKELAKDIEERLQRNKSFLYKVNRDLQREQDLLFDVEDRLQNLPATLRSYEKREELKEMLEEIKSKINSLKDKAKEIKDKVYQDEREINYILRAPKKNQTEKPKSENQQESTTTKAQDQTEQTTPNGSELNPNSTDQAENTNDTDTITPTQTQQD